MITVKKISVAAGIILSAILVCLILSSGTGSCSGGNYSDPQKADDAISITDAFGREVVLEKPAQRIACSHYSVDEAVQLAGAWDRVVAKDGYISDEKYYPGVSSLEVISPPRNPLDLNYEKIIEIHPDILILPKFEWLGDTEQITETLEPEIPVIFVDTLNPDKFCETIEIIGKVAGTDEQACEYIRFYSGIYGSIKEKTTAIPENERPKVFLKAFSDTMEEIKTWGGDFPGANELFEAAGVKNLAADLPFSCGDVDKEWFLNEDIDGIIAICWDKHYPDAFAYDVPDREIAEETAGNVREEVKNLDVFSDSDAVREDNIYLLQNEMTSTPKYIITIAYMAKWFHPELFEDLDPEAVHQEYLDRFIISDYDLSKSGVMAYPDTRGLNR